MAGAWPLPLPVPLPEAGGGNAGEPVGVTAAALLPALPRVVATAAAAGSRSGGGAAGAAAGAASAAEVLAVTGCWAEWGEVRPAVRVLSADTPTVAVVV